MIRLIKIDLPNRFIVCQILWEIIKGIEAFLMCIRLYHVLSEKLQIEIYEASRLFELRRCHESASSHRIVIC